MGGPLAQAARAAQEVAPVAQQVNPVAQQAVPAAGHNPPGPGGLFAGQNPLAQLNRQSQPGFATRYPGSLHSGNRRAEFAPPYPRNRAGRPLQP